MNNLTTKYPSYEDAILDISVYTKLLGKNMYSLDELRKFYFEEFKTTHKKPSLLNKRYELSRLVSDEYRIRYIRELELKANETLINLQQTSSTARPNLDIPDSAYISSDVKFTFSYENKTSVSGVEDLIQRYNIKTGEALDKGIMEVTNLIGSTQLNPDLEVEDEEEAQVEQEEVQEEAQVFSFEEEQNFSFEEEQDFTFEEDAGEIILGEVEDFEEEEYEENDESEEEYDESEDFDESEEEYDESEEYEEDESEEYEEDDESEEYDESEEEDEDSDSDGEYDLEEGKDSEGIIEDTQETTSEDAQKPVPEEPEIEDLWETASEEPSASEDAQETTSEESEIEDLWTDSEEPEAVQEKPEESNTSEDAEEPEIEDLWTDSEEPSASEDKQEVVPEETTIETPKSAWSSIQTQSAPSGVSNSPPVSQEPTDIRAFLRKHTKCDIEFLEQYFTKKQINDALRIGKIIKKGNKIRLP